MNQLELAFTQEEKEKNRKVLSEKLRKMGVIEPWKLEAMLEEIEKNSFKWGLDNQFPTLTIGEMQIIENSLIKKESLCIELENIEEEMQRLNSRYALVKQEISNININVCSIQGHRLSDQIGLDEDTDCHGITTGSYEYRKCFVCGKQVFEHDLKEKDVVVKKKRRTRNN